MERGIIQDNMQNFIAPITAAQPFEKGQERHPIFLLGELAHQRIAFEIISAEDVPYSTMATICGPPPIDRAGACIVFAMTRQKIQRPEFIYGNASSALGTLGVKTSNSAVCEPSASSARPTRLKASMT